MYEVKVHNYECNSCAQEIGVRSPNSITEI